MKEYYRIGETASLMGITTQTLRFYDKIGLVKPIKIDPRTGYRYYAYEQFHFIDRIKYLQSLGMPLDDIKEVMLSKKVERLLPFLDQQKKVLEEEEKKIRHQIEMVDWYKDYFTYMERNEDAPCVMHLKERYYLQVPCYKRDLLADMEIRLAKEKSEQGIDNAMYLRQYGYKISYDAFCKQKFRPDYYFIYLNEKVKDAPNILKLPEGDYLCFRERILEEAWNPQRIISYFQGKAKPELIKQVHKNYFKAGADCGITCSYQASIPGLMENGYTLEEAENLIRSAVKIFCEARDEW
ncbi:MerR family transcriptional regulator [Anaerostipes hadrus]|nr:MerR family transcriptional regulator [Anaerostipes hadrus]NSJ73056.1 MerR family transcriptional regulator [Anaerostipes hadrus]